jgi:hypothetical protein
MVGTDGLTNEVTDMNTPTPNEIASRLAVRRILRDTDPVGAEEAISDAADAKAIGGGGV